MSHHQPLSDILFIQSFRDFARSKPEGERYNVTLGMECALAQFGHPDVIDWDLKGVPKVAYDAVFEGDSKNCWNSYADLATRLDALLEGEMKVERGS